MTAAGRWTDAQLSRRCRQEDSTGWQEFIRRYTPLVYRLSYRMLSNPAEAEDVCQEVFMRIYSSFNTFDSTRSLAPWVSRITYNICVKRRQSSGRKTAGTTDYSRQNDIKDVEASDPEQQVAAREAHRACETAFKTLSAKDRALLTLRYREGLSDAEVAAAVNMPVNTVKTRIFRARQKLRDKLGAVTGEG